ncbi:MAG: hypothetical protein ACO3NZ_15305 [Pirellulales bacterium]|jgi:hypothetical protein
MAKLKSVRGDGEKNGVAVRQADRLGLATPRLLGLSANRSDETVREPSQDRLSR